MKKLFSIIALFISIVGSSQVVSTMVNSAATVTNAATVTSSLQTNGTCENVTLQSIATKSTGTVAGTVIAQYSIDGTNYVTFGDSAYLNDVTTNSHLWALTNNNFMYYKLSFIGAGTEVYTPIGYVYTSGAKNKHSTTNMLSGAATTQTTTNTATSTLSLNVTQWYSTVSIQSVVTKISGTVAGTVTLQGSLDGVNYNTVSSTYATVTSYVPTNVTTNTKIFVITGSPYKYYRLSYTGAGTMSASHKGYLLTNKK